MYIWYHLHTVYKNVIKNVRSYALHSEKQALGDIKFEQPLFNLVAIQVSAVYILGDAIVSTAGS